nr:PREDICTED: uncharacterized protein LOC109042972 isoform X2 [Bemisia tabaci]
MKVFVILTFNILFLIGISDTMSASEDTVAQFRNLLQEVAQNPAVLQHLLPNTAGPSSSRSEPQQTQQPPFPLHILPIMRQKAESCLEFSSAAIAKKTDLLDSIHQIREAWDKTSEKTIRNCFRKAGFCKTPIEIDAPSVPTTDDFEELFALEETEKICSVPTEEDICVQILQKHEEEEQISDTDEKEPPLPPPSNREMRNALATLRRGVQSLAENFEVQYQYESFVNALLRDNTKQATIDSFFK